MKRILTVTLVAALTLFAGSAYANFCARDVVPAATLLVPYVVVSMSGGAPAADGYTTYLGVTNTSSDAQIIHVVIWNAISEGVLDFDQVLSGYDVWSINFADLLSGNWSAFQTSLSASAYPNLDKPASNPALRRAPFEWGPDGRSAYAVTAPYLDPWPRGLPMPEKTSVLDVAGISDECYMDELNSDLGGQFAGTLIQRLTDPLFAREHGGCQANGQMQVRHGADWMTTLGSNPLFFYVTVDVFTRCDIIFPFEAGYFSIDIGHENVLIGDMFYVNRTSGYSEGMPVVHIEADMDSILADTALTGEDTYEFYEDQNIDTTPSYREPLASALGFRYFNDAGTVTSSVILWKNFTEFYANDDVIDCGVYIYYAWDEDEHVITRGRTCQYSPCTTQEIDPNEFPFEIQEVPLTTANFDLPDSYGWMLIIFRPSYDEPFDDPTPDNLSWDYMAWAATRVLYTDYSFGLEAATMGNGMCFPDQVQPVLGVNYDYEDGNHVPAWW